MSADDLLNRAFRARDILFTDLALANAFATCTTDVVITKNCQCNTLIDSFHFRLHATISNFLQVYKELYVQSIRSAKKDHSSIVMHPLFCNILLHVDSVWEKLKYLQEYHVAFETEQQFWMSESTPASIYRHLATMDVSIIQTYPHERSISIQYAPTTSYFRCEKCQYVCCTYDNLDSYDDFNSNEERSIMAHGKLNTNTGIHAMPDADFDAMITLLFGNQVHFIMSVFHKFLNNLRSQYNDSSPLSRYWKYHHLLRLYQCFFLSNVSSCAQFNHSLLDEGIWIESGMHGRILNLFKEFKTFTTSPTSLGNILGLIQNENLMSID